jgi:hypothetical protein
MWVYYAIMRNAHKTESILTILVMSLDSTIKDFFWAF